MRDPLGSSHRTVTADECPTRRTAATGWNRTQRRFGVKSQCQGKLVSWPTVTRLSLGCLIRRCARAKLVVQLRERYRRLITRGIVTFNFSPRNLLDSGDQHHETRTRQHGWVFFGTENNSSRRVILKIELELNNLNSILSRSAVTPVFPARA